jgi:hypothetical protein
MNSPSLISVIEVLKSISKAGDQLLSMRTNTSKKAALPGQENQKQTTLFLHFLPNELNALSSS